MRKWLMACMVSTSLLVATPPTQAFQEDTVSISILAATSLTDVLTELIRRYTQHSTVTISVTYGAPSDLKQTIIMGDDPSEVYIAEQATREMTRPEYPDWEEIRNLGMFDTSTISTLARNRLVVVGSQGAAKAHGSKPSLGAVFDAVPFVYVIDPESEAGGLFTREVLKSLGLWGKNRDKLVRVQNSRMALRMVSGEDPSSRQGRRVGITYASEAKVDPHVAVLAELPKKAYPAVEYVAAVLAQRNKANMAEARKFVEFLKTEEARAVFRDYGFEM